MNACHAFSLLEVILALIIASLVMAAIGPALVGTLRAERQVRTLLEPLAAEQSTLAILRDDLLATPQPNGSVTQPFTAVTSQVGGHRGDILTFTTNGAPALHPTVALRPPELGQATITWALRTADDGRGLAWTRLRQANLLATGVSPVPVAEGTTGRFALMEFSETDGSVVVILEKHYMLTKQTVIN